MQIFDENNVEIKNPDLSLGRLVQDRILVQHHEAVEAVAEVWHYDYRDYPNGGRDAIRIVDIPGVEAKAEWDEYEEIYRFVPYTEEELALLAEQKNQPNIKQLLARVQELEDALDLMLSGVTE